MELAGRSIAHASPHEGALRGIVIAHQHASLALDLPVWENMFLGAVALDTAGSSVAAAIGGVALEGGRAPYLGVACAAIMMTVLVSVLTAINIGESGRQIIFGLTLLAFLVIDRRFGRAL